MFGLVFFFCVSSFNALRVEAVGRSANAITDIIESFVRISAMADAGEFMSLADANPEKLIFDIGFNDGADTRTFTDNGARIVGIDANPILLDEGRRQFSDLISNGRLLLLHAGVEESTSTELVFWRNFVNPVLSSFEKAKACPNLTHPLSDCEPMRVPLVRCESLWLLGKPWYVKIDIEERHYACVRALQYLPPAILPEYISWEMHEFALGLPYPVLDTQLIIQLSKLGYKQIKLVLQHVAWVSAGLPEDVVNWKTNTTEWSDVTSVLQTGLPNPRMLTIDPVTLVEHWPWVDFYMKLSDASPK